jgi:hypothetical protein
MFTGVVVESFAYVYQMAGGTSLDREQMRKSLALAAATRLRSADEKAHSSGFGQRSIRKEPATLPARSSSRFYRCVLLHSALNTQRLSGVFVVRPYPPNMTIRSLLRASIPDPVDNAAGRLVVARGTRYAVDVRQVEKLVNRADPSAVRDRRQMFARLYHEARISEDPGRGLSFTSMLFMLAHYKLIDDEKALQ